MLAIFIRILALILSWASITLIPKKEAKKYVPVAVFGPLIITMVYEIAYLKT